MYQMFDNLDYGVRYYDHGGWILFQKGYERSLNDEAKVLAKEKFNEIIKNNEEISF